LEPVGKQVLTGQCFLDDFLGYFFLFPIFFRTDGTPLCHPKQASMPGAEWH
jgi:hypothetical protein